MVRSSLGALIMAYDDLEWAGEAEDGAQAIQLATLLQPDIVLMDLVMPVLDGAAATSAILEKCPHTQVIALTSFGDEELVRDAVAAGAISYIIKSVSAQELVRVIREAHGGRGTMAPEALRALHRDAPPASS